MQRSRIGRNEPCPCGSGKKFKRCCIERVQAEERAAEAHWRAADAAEPGRFDKFDELSERVLGLIERGQLDEAEATARQLETEFPDDTMGIERLGQVSEARGMTAEAAQHYRRAVDAMDALGRGKFCDCCRARMVKAVRRVDPHGPALVLGPDPQ